MHLLIPSGLDESILEECLQHLEKQLESSQARKAMEEFFSERWSHPESCSPRTLFLFLFLLVCHCQHLSGVNAIAQEKTEPCKDRILFKQCSRVWKDFLCGRGSRSLSLQINIQQVLIVIISGESCKMVVLSKALQGGFWEVLVYKAVAKFQVLSVLPRGNRLIIFKGGGGVLAWLRIMKTNCDGNSIAQQQCSEEIWGWTRGKLFSIRKSTIVWFCSLLVKKWKQSGGWLLYFVNTEGKNRQENLEFWFGNQYRPFCDLICRKYWYATQELMRFTGFSLS